MESPQTNRKAQLPEYMNKLVDQSEQNSKDITKYARTLVYGEFGAGKSHFAGTFPNPLFIDTDHGMTTNLNRATKKTPPAIRYQSGDKIYSSLMKLISDISAKRGPFAKDGEFSDIKSIVFDGLTSLTDCVMDEIVLGQTQSRNIDRSEFKPSYDEWGMLKLRMQSILEALKVIPYHLCLTSMATINKDEATGAYIGEFDIAGSTRNLVGRLYNEIYFIEKRRAKASEQQEYKREVVHEFYTLYHPKFKVKSRLGEKYAIPAKAVNPTFASLYGKIYEL